MSESRTAVYPLLLHVQTSYIIVLFDHHIFSKILFSCLIFFYFQYILYPVTHLMAPSSPFPFVCYLYLFLLDLSVLMVVKKLFRVFFCFVF